ncbi:MAG: PIN domain nuclease [Nevskia sp.]|nr:PIN domain nuclease [Nevskia sp.]
MLIVDTSVWIDHLNGHPSPEALKLVAAIERDEPIAVPGPVMTEILLGIRSERQARLVAELLTGFESAGELEREDYVQAARIFRVCRAAGYTLRSTIDCLIARLCLRGGHELLTKDRDFEAIRRCFPLRLLT